MKITVHTVYENIPETQVQEWANKVFDSHWVGKKPKDFSQIFELKFRFLKGQVVKLVSCNPEHPIETASTTWTLER